MSAAGLGQTLIEAKGTIGDDCAGVVIIASAAAGATLARLVADRAVRQAERPFCIARPAPGAAPPLLLLTPRCAGSAVESLLSALLRPSLPAHGPRRLPAWRWIRGSTSQATVCTRPSQ